MFNKYIRFLDEICDKLDEGKIVNMIYLCQSVQQVIGTSFWLVANLVAMWNSRASSMMDKILVLGEKTEGGIEGHMIDSGF